MISVFLCKVSQPSLQKRKSYDGKFVTVKCSNISDGATLNRKQCWPAFSFINHISGIVLEHLQELSNFRVLSLRSNHFTHVAIHVLINVKSFHCQPSPHSRCVLVKSKKGHCGILCDTAWSRSTSTVEKPRTIFIISNLCIIIFPYGPYSRSTTNIKERNMKSM